MCFKKRLILLSFLILCLGQVFKPDLEAKPALKSEARDILENKWLKAYKQLYHSPHKEENLKIICQELLKEALKDEDPYNRVYAAAALIEMGDFSALNSLKKEVSNEDALVRTSVYLEMAEMEKRGKLSAMPVLMDIFAIEEARVKIQLLEALKEEVKDNFIFPLLEWALKFDQDYLVRSVAAEALGEISHPSSLTLLKKAVEDEHILVRLSAMSSLARKGEKSYLKGLIEAMKDEDPAIRERAAGLMGRVRDKSGVSLLKKSLAQEESPSTKITIAGSLAELGDPSGISYLEKKLGDSHLSLHAIKTLGRASQTSCLPIFKRALKDNNPFVRIFAVIFIGKMRNRSTLPLLEEALKDMDAGVRIASAQALGEIGDPKAIGSLRETFKDEDPGVRITALRAITRLLNPHPGKSLAIPQSK